MAKPGRNDPCPCGSGNKYKKCCLMKDEAAEVEVLAVQKAARDEHAAAHQMRLRDAKAEFLATLAGARDDEMYDDPFDDTLMHESNAVVELVHAGKLDEAEIKARDLLERYPDVHDGYDRLGMVHEARGEKAEAAKCYRKVVEIIRQHPDDHDASFTEVYTNLVAKLEPPPAA